MHFQWRPSIARISRISLLITVLMMRLLAPQSANFETDYHGGNDDFFQEHDAVFVSVICLLGCTATSLGQ